MEKCPVCGRKILINDVINGVSHTVGTTAICIECVDIRQLQKMAKDDNTYMDQATQELLK